MSSEKIEYVRAMAAMFWNGTKDDQAGAKLLHEYADLLEKAQGAAPADCVAIVKALREAKL